MAARIAWTSYFKNRAKRHGLRQRLQSEGRTRWLDVGSTRFDPGFDCLDLTPAASIKEENRARYTEANILNLTDADVASLGAYDLVRMQHVLEHFSMEEAPTVLRNCARLLAPQGLILITVPDLALMTRAYLGRFRWGAKFVKFARFRLAEDAPPSFIFSVFAHQTGYREFPYIGQDHKWCYDFEGVAYQLKRSEAFGAIERIPLLSALAETPFTHGRPLEDECVMARKA